MKFDLLTLVSSVHDVSDFPSPQEMFSLYLDDGDELVDISSAEIPEAKTILVFIHTGGTEGQFQLLFPALERTGKPITLLSASGFNSLPAALECLAWVNQERDYPITHVHFGGPAFATEFQGRLKALRAWQSVRGAKFGLFGDPSDWLIASRPNLERVARKWACGFTSYPLLPFVEQVKKKRGRIKLEKYKGLLPPHKKAVEKTALKTALAIYECLRGTVSKDGLTGLTIRCFDLLSPLGSTGCLALSMLNSEGICAGCEGDIPTMLTMHIMHLLSQKMPFMANTADIQGKEILFAHCTAPLNLVKNLVLDTHFESGIGVAIKSEFHPGPVTIARIGRSELENYYVYEGEALPQNHAANQCRTQIRVNSPELALQLRQAPLGNHHVVIPGRYAEAFKETMRLMGIRRSPIIR